MWTNRTGICRPGKSRFGFGMMTVCALVMSLLLCLTGCQPARSSLSAAAPDSTTDGAGTAGQQVVLYFSATGNTEQAARTLAQTLEAPLVALEPEQAYTEADLDYTDADSRVSLEHDGTLELPGYQDPGTQVQEAQIVWLGYPIWWGEPAAVIRSYVADGHLKGKTVILFCTSGGTGIEESEQLLKDLEPDADWRSGKRLPASVSGQELQTWISETNIR